MNLDQLERMSVEALRRTANEKLGQLEAGGAGPGAASTSAPWTDQGPILSEAQFYLDEIERREGREERRRQSRIGFRDFILEVIVIVLIGLEIIFGIVGGNQQLAALKRLKDGSDQQLALLQTMNTSAGQTATILKNLSDEQNQALTAQQQTLQIITQMNGALQAQLGLSYVPELTLTYNESQKSLLFQNFGKMNISLFGTKVSDQPERLMFPEPRIIVPSTGFTWSIEESLKAVSLRVPKGGREQVRYDVYFKNAKEKKFTASYFVIFLWKGDAMSVSVQMIGIAPEGW